MAGFLAFLTFWSAPSPALAATLVPCTATNPPGVPVVEIDGDSSIVQGRVIRKVLRRNGVRTKLLAPANSFTGKPSFPVTSVSYTDQSRVGLGGGFQLIGKRKRQLQVRGLTVVIKPGGVSVVNARFAGGLKRLFLIRGGTIRHDTDAGALYVNGGRLVLSGIAARTLRKRLGLRKVVAVRGGRAWGLVDLFSTRKVTVPPSDPEAETPVEPPVAVRPAGAIDLTAGTIDWRVRDSFISYVSSGDGANAIDGAIPGPSEGAPGNPKLVYSFKFPFTSGWVDPVPGSAPDSALIKGTGGVSFRYCHNTINFMVHDPEIELNGDLSRMIFRVKGSDGTAFPDSRAIMVGLRLNQAESVETVGNTTTYSKVPGFVPTGSEGIFADFYMPGDTFGNLTISLTTG